MQKETEKIVNILEKEYPEIKIALDYKNPLELLVSTVLSAQCTDAQVNKITPFLFKKYKTPEDYANSNLTELEEMIHSTGFYKNKAKNIKNAGLMIVKDFGGRVPDSMKDLTKLPGVARKTANIVLSNAFGKVEGIAVDTHVGRISKRLGLSKENDPNKIEQDLMGLFPKKDWAKLNHLLVTHGRQICIARKPKCNICSLNKLCPSAF